MIASALVSLNTGLVKCESRVKLNALFLGVKCEEKPLITSKGKKSFLTYVISKSEGKAPKEKKRKKTKRKTPSDYYKRAESL
jgi:hypothetical protein